MEVLNQLSNDDKNVFFSSLPFLSKNMEFFVLRFYYYFLQTKAGNLFQNTNINVQYKMFNTAVNVLITHIADPTQLEHAIDGLVNNHVKYGVEPDHINYFIDSFMNALGEIFNKDAERTLNVWYNVISEIMLNFRNKL